MQYQRASTVVTTRCYTPFSFVRKIAFILPAGRWLVILYITAYFPLEINTAIPGHFEERCRYPADPGCFTGHRSGNNMKQFCSPGPIAVPPSLSFLLLRPIIFRQSSANTLFYYIQSCENALGKKPDRSELICCIFFFLFVLTILHCFGLLHSLGGLSFMHAFALLLSNLPSELLFGSGTHPLPSPTILFHFKSFFCQLQLGLTMLRIQFPHFGIQKRRDKYPNTPLNAPILIL